MTDISSLAYSIFENKGVFALFLGAGISKSAGLPTGWEIVTDNIRKLAAQEGVTNLLSPESWYEKKYGKKADYSSILNDIATTPSERINILRSYFETDKEGNKVIPSQAHQDIAKLVRKGYIQIILTTNFDRLMETALAEEGVSVQVIKDGSDIAGAVPLVRNVVTLVKINGDYLDSRFKNTEEELDCYSIEMDSYITRILEDYGLITCGWSAQWDNGLKKIIRGIQNHRYSSVFTFVGNCNSSLNDISSFRGGSTIKIDSADSLFHDLLERIEAMERIRDVQHPLSDDIAIARAKKYLSEPCDIISLNDLLMGEARRAKQIIDGIHNLNDEMFHDNFSEKVKDSYRALMSLVGIGSEIAHWSKDAKVYSCLCNAVKILSLPSTKMGNSFRKDALYCYRMAFYTLYYSLTFACVKHENYGLFKELTCMAVPKEITHERIPAIEFFHDKELTKDQFNTLINQSYHTPHSTYIHKTIQNYTNSLCIDEAEEHTYFDIMEYLLRLVYHHIVKDEFGWWLPTGEYKWRESEYRNSQFKEFFNEADTMKDEWPILKAGLFNGSYDTYSTIKAEADSSKSNSYFY